MGLLSLIIWGWQIMILRGKVIKNTDGSSDGWQEQKTQAHPELVDHLAGRGLRWVGIYPVDNYSFRRDLFEVNMNIIWGITLTLISSLGWLGQVITAFWPETAVTLNLTEPETDVDPTFYADVRGEAYWDTAVLWILPVAGVFLLLNNAMWAYFGLVGGGMTLYFAGRGIAARKVMQHCGIRIGTPEAVKVNLVFLALSGLVAIVTIVMAIAALPLT